MTHLFFIISLILIFQNANAADCNEWFKKEKLKPGSSCYDQCDLRGLGTDEDDLVCSVYCTKLCKGQKVQQNPSDIKNTSWLDVVTYYPGLTEAEKKLIKENPKEAFQVFLQKNTAEEAAQRNFPNGFRNDESDAFRHFTWAGLLTKVIGINRAQVYLDAHEASGTQPENEKAMDLANNRAGLLEAQRLEKENNLKLESIEKAALESLRKKQLIVLDPQGYIPMEIK